MAKRVRILGRCRRGALSPDADAGRNRGDGRRAARARPRNLPSQGPAAAVLLYDPARRVVMLVKQFRLGAYLADGALGDDRGLRRHARRRRPGDLRAARSAGKKPASGSLAPRHAFDAFTSPGALTEKICLLRRALWRRGPRRRRRRRRRRRAYRSRRDRLRRGRGDDRHWRDPRREDDRPALLRQGDRTGSAGRRPLSPAASRAAAAGIVGGERARARRRRADRRRGGTARRRRASPRR